MRKQAAKFISKVLSKSAQVFVRTNKAFVGSPKTPKELLTK